MRPVLKLLTAGAAVSLLALGACNQNATPTKPVPGSDTAGGLGGTTPGAPPPATTPPVTTPPPGTPGTIPAAAPPCRSGDLSISRLAADAGAGQRQVTYAFVNNGPAACSLKGYPTFVTFDADGKRLDSLQVVQTEASYFNTGGPPQDVPLTPGSRAVFFISFTGIQATDKPCVAVARIQVTPPGNTQAMELQDTLQPCTGQIHLTPVRAYSAASGIGGSLSM